LAKSYHVVKCLNHRGTLAKDLFLYNFAEEKKRHCFPVVVEIGDQLDSFKQNIFVIDQQKNSIFSLRKIIFIWKPL
jgi:Mg2+ and Co2+ transporter CorA